jgi:hypothetical protein
LTESDYVYETLRRAVRLTAVMECCPFGKVSVLVSFTIYR